MDQNRHLGRHWLPTPTPSLLVSDMGSKSQGGEGAPLEQGQSQALSGVLQHICGLPQSPWSHNPPAHSPPPACHTARHRTRRHLR